MSTALTTIPNELPAYLKNRLRENNAAAIGGIKAGGFPQIKIPGGKFFLANDGETVLITDPMRPDLPLQQLELVVAGFNPNLTKIYYEGVYSAGDDHEPDCSSDDGVTPDSSILAPQASACAVCTKNAWGSKINEQGKQIKACSDNKRIVVLRSDELDGLAMGLTITPAALKGWAEYVRLLDSKGISVMSVVTKVQFDPTVSFPKLSFKFGRFLTEEELAIVEERAASEEVKYIASPRRATRDSGLRQTIPIQAAVAKPAATAAPVAVAVVQTVAPVAQPAPAPAEIPVSNPADHWSYGLPAAIVGAVEAVGGPGTEAGLIMIRQFRPTWPWPNEPVEKPVDPFEGMAAHVKPAVDASGGLGTVAGDAVYKALTSKEPPASSAPATVAAPEVKKTRARKPAEPVVVPVAQPSAPAPTVQPAAQPAPSMVSGPTVGAGGLGAELESLLASVMGGTPAA